MANNIEAKDYQLGSIQSITKTDTHFMIKYEGGEQAQLSILNSHVFRYYMSPTGIFLENPVPNNPHDFAKINIKRVSDYGNKAFKESGITSTDQYYIVNTNKIEIHFDKTKGTIAVCDNRTNKDIVFRESQPISYSDNKTTQVLQQHKDEYFFGGGMQNGRFSHKGEIIEIVNNNNWVDGGVSSPCPFYWSTYGYGVLRNTWQPGTYDFGPTTSEIKTVHEGEDFDTYYFINSQPKDILGDYYELTGHPILMPEYAFYEAHLNTFNRDYWVKVKPDTPNAILFEDGHYYKSYKPNDIHDQDGILESLNGECNNYQFSARAMIDRYNRHDMPLGWFIPNDGYGSGYGQTDSLDGDIQNLKEFRQYAKNNGVEVALWTESNLEPADPKNPKKGERDLKKEVGIAGAVALKCDVAWIGSGYSFGLNAVENATNIFINEMKRKIRPMIIMVDGWAGTQRYSGIWTGDQSGGQWEYIRFHIPTYIGAGLSGLPVVGSDMDGIYGGKTKEINVRDYQWKTFTPLQLNMDGWGNISKTPFSFDNEATAINRAYLKLKSMLMPYNYTLSHESTTNLPMIRAMFLEFPEEPLAYTNDSQYEYMWGPSILVAPVYNEKTSLEGEFIRNGIYLPDTEQVWIDFFTGRKYQGGKIYNSFKVPLWKIPVFVKDGAIIPMSNANNNPYEINRDIRIINIYPNKETSFNVYEDDGISAEYSNGHFTITKISVIGPKSNKVGSLLIHVHKTTGSYKDFVKERTTIIRIMASESIEHMKVAINDKSLKMLEVDTDEDFNEQVNVYYFKKDFVVNPYLNNLAGSSIKQRFLMIKITSLDITMNDIFIKIKDYANINNIFGSNNTLNNCLKLPAKLDVIEEELTPTAIALQWEAVDEAIYYEIDRDGDLFSNIIDTEFTFDGFRYESVHCFKIRSVNEDGISKWSDSVTVVTKDDPYKHTVKGVITSCNIPCQPDYEVCKLNNRKSTGWHTRWDETNVADPKKGKIIKLYFDLQDVYDIEKVEYRPRKDAGNGTFLEIQYRYSIDGKDWSRLSNRIHWNRDALTKTILVDGEKLRYFELDVIDAVGGFGSGKHILFYKKINA